MPYRKSVKKSLRRGVRAVKKRYTYSNKARSGVKLGKLARDVYRIQRSLNVEHKHIDYKFGSSGAITAQKPTKNTPIIFPLNTPVKGTAYDNRIGNQLRVIHMTAKAEFTFHNNTDLVQRQSCRMRIIFAKDADDVPVIANLLDADANGHYTPLSFTNTQEYKKYVWMNKLTMFQSYTQPTNRYPASMSTAYTVNPLTDQSGGIGNVGGNENILVTDTASQPLNIAQFYQRKETKCSIKMLFQNNSDNVEQMKPYVVLTSDVVEDTGDDYDYITVSGQVRMTYVDN